MKYNKIKNNAKIIKNQYKKKDKNNKQKKKKKKKTEKHYKIIKILNQ